MKDEGNKAEEAKGRKDNDEGIVRRKGESLETEDGLTEELGKETAVEKESYAGDRELEEADRLELEVRKHKIGRRPLLPTKAETDGHYPAHLNYRSLCARCVVGKARSSQHVKLGKKRKGSEQLGMQILRL